MDVGLKVSEGVSNAPLRFTAPPKRIVAIIGGGVNSLNAVQVDNLKEARLLFPNLSVDVEALFREAGDAPVILTQLPTKRSDFEGEGTYGRGFLYFDEDQHYVMAWKGSPIIYDKNQMQLEERHSSRESILIVYRNGEEIERITASNSDALSARVMEESHFIMRVGVAAEGLIVRNNKNYLLADEVSYSSKAGNVLTFAATDVLKAIANNFTTGSDCFLLRNGEKFAISDVQLSDSSVNITLTDASAIQQSDSLDIYCVVSRYGVSVSSQQDAFTDNSVTVNIDAVTGNDVQIIAGVAKPDTEATWCGCELLNGSTKVSSAFEELNSRGILAITLSGDSTSSLFDGRCFYAIYSPSGAVSYKGYDGNIHEISPVCPVVGACFIRVPYIYGDEAHIPPAGTDSVFKYTFSFDTLEGEQLNEMVQGKFVNVVRYFDSLGWYMGSSRVREADPLWNSVHIFMQNAYYKRYLERLLKYAEQKPNTPELKQQLLRDSNIFFKGEYDKGALERSVDFETAYQGVCDLSNNPRTQDRKELNLDLYYIPTECTESIHVTLYRNDGILQAL